MLSVITQLVEINLYVRNKIIIILSTSLLERYKYLMRIFKFSSTKNEIKNSALF